MALGFGILGAGMISSLHGDALRKSKKAKLVAVCDVDQARAQKLATQFAPEARVYTRLEDMLNDPQVKVVNVVTPNHLHHEAVLKIAAAGRHVMCEKPPAMSLKHTDEMIAACAQAKVKFGIYVQCRVREPIRAMKQALAAGRFGRLLRADATMKWFRTSEYYKMDAWRSQRKSGAGVTIQHAFHYIDLLQYLAGPAQTVRASMCNLAHPDVNLEDTLDARIQFAGGAIGTISASTAAWPGTDVRVELFGEKGAAVMSGAAFALWQFKEEQPGDEAIRHLGKQGQATGGSSPTALESHEHQFVMDDCVDAIEQGREVHIPCAAVRPSLEMALAMYQADRLGQPVTLPLVDEDKIWG